MSAFTTFLHSLSNLTSKTVQQLKTLYNANAYTGFFMTILSILDNIGSDTKRSHKLRVLELHKDNSDFMKVVKLALDPYVNFYIKKIPTYKSQGVNSISWALAELEKLSTRQVTGNAGIAHLQYILNSISENDATVITRVISKDLRCGIADGIVNAVVEDFIPAYPCLLARPYNEKNIKNIVYPAYSQLKADGLRVNFHLNGESSYICGRSGREIDLLGQLDHDCTELANQFNEPVVIDGELVVVDTDGNILPRKIGNGIISRAIKGTISVGEAEMVRAKIWDVIPAKEFNSGKSSTKYSKRFSSVASAIELINQQRVDNKNRTVSKFSIIESRVVANLEQAQDHFNEMLNRGEEGIILKNFNGIWEDNRSKDLVKFKAEKDCDLEIIGWNPGTGKFNNMVGSLICASSDRQVEVSISGFDDKLRQEITNTINSLMGTIVSVMYNERIKSKTRSTVDSLFLPRFIEFRHDKSQADSSSTII